MQLLSVAEYLSEEIKDMLWNFFETTMIPVIIKYQLIPEDSAQLDLTKEGIERILCSAVEQQPVSTVSSTVVYTYTYGTSDKI